MRKIVLVTLVFIVLYTLESNCTTVTEFFNNLPDDISNAFSNAWKNMKSAVKRPVRIRRLGRGGRRKHSRRSNTTTTTKATTSATYLVMLKKLELPVLPTPRWRSLDDWKNLQIPRFAFKSDRLSRRGTFGDYIKLR